MSLRHPNRDVKWLQSVKVTWYHSWFNCPTVTGHMAMSTHLSPNIAYENGLYMLILAVTLRVSGWDARVEVSQRWRFKSWFSGL